MKGMVKSIKRTPHMVTTKIGMAKKSNDPEFDEHSRNFGTLETATDKLLKESKAFIESCNSFFTSGAGYSANFASVFKPLKSEFDLAGKYPDALHTVKNVDAHRALMEELKDSVQPELELIKSRIMGPTMEFKEVLKSVRKSITKRDHKLVDYDRFNNSLTKLREKKERSLSDEKNLFKLEQDFELATNEYEYINEALKQDLPRFMILATRFIDPLFHSFFYMQLNVYYMLLEKMNGFAEKNYEVAVSASQIAEDYEAKRTDAWQEIENLNIAKRIISTSKMVQSNRALNPGSSSLARSTTGSSSSLTSRTPSGSGSGFKKPPPPPPSFGSKEKDSQSLSATPNMPPPPYSPSSATTSNGTVMGKKPPPPPPLKPKPKAEPAVQYVVALYDFEAQADGDLNFKAGDRIEIVERTTSSEDWWTGRVNGKQGVFPGNYVQDT